MRARASSKRSVGASKRSIGSTLFWSLYCGGKSSENMCPTVDVTRNVTGIPPAAANAPSNS